MTVNRNKFILLGALAVGLLFSGAAAAQAQSEPSDVQSLVKISKGIANLVKAPKAADADEPVPPPPPGKFDRLPVPAAAGVVLRAASLNALDDAVSKFFAQTSGADFSVLSALRLTDYRRVLGAIDPGAELGIVAFCKNAPPELAVLLPVSEKNFPAFVTALAKTAPEQSSSIGSDGKTANITLKLGDSIVVVARQITPDYVALVQASDARLLDFFELGVPRRPEAELPPGLTAPALSLEATPVGLMQLTEENRPFWKEVEKILDGIEKTLQEAQVAANLTEIREHIRQNLLALRVDVSIDEYGVYLSTQTTPRPDSQSAKQLASFGELPPLNAEADRFFVVLPDVEAPLSGQSDIAPLLAESLPKPFNRLKFVEYSLNLPLESELAAESWQFFLEVDDADEFVKEMIIPKARAIGSYIGSKQVEDVGAQLFGAIAERRLSRQETRRRQPRRLVDPEEAAQRGAALGNLLGSAIGADSGEQSAMKQYKFDDYKMYISDLETYARQTKLMQAEAAGQNVPNAPGAQLLFDRNRPLLSALDVLMANVENGDALQNMILRSANEQAEQVDNSPLFARKSNIIVLDKTHILLGLGNEDLLRMAVNNWKSLSVPSIRYMGTVADRDGIVNLQNLYVQIPNPEDSKLVTAIRLDLASGQAYYQWLAEYYLPGAPKLDSFQLPDGMPKALVVSSIAGPSEFTRVVAPHKMISDIFETFSGGQTPLQAILQSKQADAGEAAGESEGDLDDAFN